MGNKMDSRCGGQKPAVSLQQNPKKGKTQTTTNISYIPPDGGWGWFVTFAAFCTTALASILVPTFGMIYSTLFMEHPISSTTISWIFNVNQFLWNMSGIVGAPLFAHFGVRRTVVFAGLLMSTSVIISGYLPKPQYLFITYSIFLGFGQGLAALAAVCVAPLYFEKRKGIACGIAFAGICAGQFIGPLLAHFLLEQYGFKGTTLILGGILLHVSVAGMVFHPVEWHSKKQIVREIPDVQPLLKIQSELISEACSDKELKDSHLEKFDECKTDKLNHNNYFSESINCNISSRSLSFSHGAVNFGLTDIPSDLEDTAPVKNNKNFSFRRSLKSVFRSIYGNLLLFRLHRVQIIAVSVALVLTSYINFLMMVPFTMRNLDQPLYLISWALFAAGFSNMLARLTVSALTDILPVSTKVYFMIGASGTCLFMNAFCMVTRIEWIILIMFCFGFSVGICICLMSLAVIEFVGLDFLPQVLGVEGFTIAIFFLAVGPLSGMVRDMTGSYATAVQLLSLSPLCAFCLWFLMAWAVNRDEEKRQDSRVSLKEESLA